MPKRYRSDLNGRIEFLADQGDLGNRIDCHRIRRRRNEIAHQIQEQAKWSEVENDVKVVHDILHDLGLVGAWEVYEFFGERSGSRESNDPHVAFAQDIAYGVKSGEVPIYTIKFTKNVHRLSGEQ